MYVLTIPNFDIWQTAETMQDINFVEKHGFDRHACFFFKGEDIMKVEQHGERFLFSCSDEKFYSDWFDFFDISTDYNVLQREAMKLPSAMVAGAARKSSGVHILKQDPFECLLKECMMVGCSPAKAREKLQSVKEATTEEKGRNIPNFTYMRWHPMPTPDQLREGLDLLDWFCDTKTASMCKTISEWAEGHRMLLKAPETHSEEDTEKELSKLGLSKHKVDRIMAFGFGYTNRSCLSVKASERFENEAGVDIDTAVEFCMPEWAGKSAYLGLVTARMQALSNMNRKQRRWG